MTRTVLGRLAVSVVLIAAPVGVANAAAPAPAFDWNGFYVGAYAGAAWMDQATTTDPCLVGFFAICTATGIGTYNSVPATSYDMGPSFVGGGTVGVNWQPTAYTMLGLENNFGYLHLKGAISQDPPPIFNGDTIASTKLGSWYDAFTARVGAVDGHAMFYLKGGGAAVRYSTGVIDTSPFGGTLNTTVTKTLTGWAAGGGIEYGIDMHWSVKAEYLVLGVARNVTNCGTGLFTLGPAGFAPAGAFTFCGITHTPDVQTITLGLNYRFR
jgi:outer membrane immunogenic protein